MIYLDRNENQFGPAPECFNVLARASRNELSNYSRDYVRGVKSILSETLARTYDLSEANVLLGYGCEDMLKQAVHCYLDRGAAIMVPQYSWWYYKSVAGEVGGRVIEYPMHITEDRFAYDPEEIVALVRSVKPRILLFASPNNPTGNSLSMEDVDFLLSRCADTKFIIDEAYFGFADSSHQLLPQRTRDHPTLAVLRTFSKLYGLAGVRIGYAFVGNGYELLAQSSGRYLGYNLLSEQLALTALRNSDYYKSLAATTVQERKRYEVFFHAIEGCTAYRSEANFLLVRLPHEDNEPLKKHLLSAGIAIKFFPPSEFPDHVRITVGTPEQNDLLLNALKDYFVAKRVPLARRG